VFLEHYVTPAKGFNINTFCRFEEKAAVFESQNVAF
jgi:hypothetical protein